MVRKQLNIASDATDYQQSAIVTRTTLRRSHQQIAYERFNEKGAIAMLPLPENECATIWSADNDSIAKLMLLSEEEFLQKLQKEFGYRLGKLIKIEKRHVFPLRMLKAEKIHVDGVFLLGNAAHTLHPIAAQGFNLALYEVAAIAEGILTKLAKHQNVSALDLQQISDNTQKQRSLSLNVSHHLAQLFSAESILISFVLQMGMLGLDIATPIKTKFIRGIMGRLGSVPRLLLNASEL